MKSINRFVIGLVFLFPACLFASPMQEACLACPPTDWCAYPRSDFKVDNACVDFCLDYEHNLSECQKSCTN